MPEGDTVHRIARVLRRDLVGRTVERVELHDMGEVRELAGRTLESVEARGKHTLLTFEGGWSLRVHLGMKGRWTRLRARQRRPARSILTLVSGDTAWVCHRAWRVETVRTTALATHPRLQRLGPDLLADPPSVDEAVRRASLPAHAGREIAEVLLDQRVAAGIGNVYKSEVLFECRVHPRIPVGHLSPETLERLYAASARLMRANLRTRRRTTVPLPRRPEPSSERLWVYGRDGKPCRECGAPVERFLQGDLARSTYFCPRCQRDT